MWRVDNFQQLPVELDFSSSDRGRHIDTAIHADGVRLFNAIQLVEVEANGAQVEICEQCGMTHCEPGGWVEFRRIAENVTWIPNWEVMEKSPHDFAEYGPPKFLRARGAPVFSSAVWDSLRGIHRKLPDVDSLPPLDSRAAARLCQWSAPSRLLGEFPAEPKLERAALLAVTEGALAAEADAIDTCLEEYFAVRDPMKFAPLDQAATPIEFWLDRPGIPAWTGFARFRGTVCLMPHGYRALVRE